MPTNKQRRDTARRHLERQLQHRQERAARQRRINLIASIAGTLVIIAAIIVVVVLANSGNDKNKTASQAGAGGHASAGATSPAATTASPAPTTPTAAPEVPPVACAKPSKGSTATFDGVTVKKATDLAAQPVITSHVTKQPKTIQCMDLVIGKGAAATPKSTVSVDYVGALLSNGKVFDSSKAHGNKPISFSLTGVVPGFTQGIGGYGKIDPMRVGGRRLIIMPPALGYGSQASGAIPANSSLIFVVDLAKTTG